MNSKTIGSPGKTLTLNRPSLRARGVARILFLFALIVSIPFMALALFKMPGAMERVELDWSWQGALGYFTAHGFRFGPDVLYTYGPLGFLQANVNVGLLLRTIFIAHVLMDLATAALFAFVAWRSRSWIVLALITFNVVYFGAYEADSIPICIIAILTVLCISMNASSALIIITGLAGGCLALIKFNYFLQIAFCLSGAIFYLLISQQRPAAATLIRTFVIALFSFWIVLGNQPFSAFPTWVRGAWEVAAAFNLTMFGEAPQSILFWGILEIAALMGLALLLAFSSSRSLATFLKSAILCGTLFLVWRQGYVRPDFGHFIVVPLAAQILAPFIYAQTIVERRPRFIIASALALFAAIGLSYICLSEGRKEDASYADIFSPQRVLASLQGNSWLLGSLEQYRNDVITMEARAEKANALPKLSRLIKNSTVDVFGDEVGIAILNHWNYRPRPMFQSFSAYSSYLLDRNAHYVTSVNAPEFYLMTLQSIDGRLPTEADGRALRLILSRYEAIDAERGYLLFKKLPADQDNSSPQSYVVHTGIAEINHEVRFGAIPGGHFGVVALNLRSSYLGKLKELLLHPPLVTLRITTESRQVLDYRLLPTVAQEGILIDPPIRDIMDLHSLIQGTYRDRVATFAVLVDLKNLPYFQTTFNYSIEESPGVHVGGKALLSDLIGFGAEPLHIESPYYPRLMDIDGQNVLFAHAPSSISFNVPSSASRVFGTYGVAPGAFQATQGTKAVDFDVVVITKGGAQILFHDSLTVSAMRNFDVALPKQSVSTVELRFGCKPGCDGGWTYWQGISFAQRP